jgi:hypothetical protein
LKGGTFLKEKNKKKRESSRAFGSGTKLQGRCAGKSSRVTLSKIVCIRNYVENTHRLYSLAALVRVGLSGGQLDLRPLFFGYLYVIGFNII